MNALPWIKLAVAVLGITIWAFGYSRDSSTLRWIGIGVLLAAALMRFIRPRKHGPDALPPT